MQLFCDKRHKKQGVKMSTGWTLVPGEEAWRFCGGGQTPGRTESASFNLHAAKSSGSNSLNSASKKSFDSFLSCSFETELSAGRVLSLFSKVVSSDRRLHWIHPLSLWLCSCEKENKRLISAKCNLTISSQISMNKNSFSLFHTVTFPVHLFLYSPVFDC